MSIATYADPVVYAEPQTRASFLRKVGMLTFLGLSTAAVVGFLSAGVVFFVPVLGSPMISLAVMLIALYGGGQFIGRRMVASDNPAVKYAGFFGGSASIGVALGYLLLAAGFASMEVTGNPFILMLEAVGLTGMLALGMFVYLMTGPKNLSMLRAGLAISFFPMIGIMIAGIAFPGLFGGPIGLLFSVVFVLVSAGGMLYTLNEVMHKVPATMHVEAAYEVTLGLLILFWNILVLLMRMNRR